VASLPQWFEALQPRERRMVTIGGVVAAVLVVFAVLLPLDHSVTRAHERLERKQADLAWMRSVAPRLAGIGPVTAPASQRSLIVVVDNAAREAGLGTALTSSEPSGQGGLRVRLDNAQFDILVGWLARLSEQHGIRVESATVDASGPPGVVNAGIVLHARQ
jgi:general secretion pathway protein M